MTVPSSSQAINWFEIPCADLGRAQSFYERMLDRPMRREDFGGEPMALFSKDDPATGGCLVARPFGLGLVSVAGAHGNARHAERRHLDGDWGHGNLS